MKATEIKAMIFAAGLGTRLKPFTLDNPKALFPVNGVPLLERNIKYLQSFGVNSFVINVHHFADKIELFLKENNNFNANIEISDERDELLETGGGLWKANNLLGNQPFLVMNSDILTNLNIQKLIDFHSQRNPLATLAVSDRKSTRKLLFNKEDKLCGWKDLRDGEMILSEEKYSKELAFSGIHIIDPKIFEYKEYTAKFSIMKPYLDLMQKEEFLAYNHTGDILLDVGKPEAVPLAEKWFE